MAGSLQFSASYIPLEDRLLLQGTFPDKTEIRLLFTRRLTRGLLKGLDELSERLVEDEAAPKAVKRQVASFTREIAIDKADFAKQYEKGETHPLMAEAPRLVREMSFTPKAGNRVALVVKLDKGERINFALPADALWSLGHLMAKQAARAEWDLGEVASSPPPRHGRLN